MDHPRIRGEHGGVAWMGFGATGSSPHTRGALPDRAGLCETGADHPRIRGEHDFDLEAIVDELGSSPHTRGARNPCPPTGSCRRIIPAYAGSTPPAPSSRGPERDHPRIRGEHGPPMPVNSTSSGSSPHTRGALLHHHEIISCSRIIPAYAGSTASGGVRARGRRDHPRIRGEHDGLPIAEWRRAGSSPHTRGALILKSIYSAAPRIIPAYAGSTAMNVWKAAFSPGSSPHTRGALTPPSAPVLLCRIIPAYAGSTRPRRNVRRRRPDHPRIRGEHRYLND